MQMHADALLHFSSASPASAVAGELQQAGLNLFAMLDAEKINDSTIPLGASSLMLIGSYGRQLWDCIPASYHRGENPVDDFSASAVTQTLTSVLGNCDWTMLYPSSSAATAPALQQLGCFAGWHHPSPLGNGIHPEFGLWFAYRSVVAINGSIAAITGVPQNTEPALHANAGVNAGVNVSDCPVSVNTKTNAGVSTAESPCVSCVDQPCIAVCPASALHQTDAPDLTACAGFRTTEQSPCAERCIARERCPVGVQFRYADDQIRYYYKQSLEALRRWVAETGAPDSR